MGEWLPFCALNFGCCSCGTYQPPVAWNCYTTPAEGKGTWWWCCLCGLPMGGCGSVEKKADGGLLFEHGHYGPFHGGFCCLRGRGLDTGLGGWRTTCRVIVVLHSPHRESGFLVAAARVR